MLRAHVVLVSALASLAACNANVAVDRASTTTGGQGGGGTTTTTTTATTTSTSTTTATTTSTSTTTTTLPDACAVPAGGPGPYGAIFRIWNNTAASLFLNETCYVDVAVTACADGYAAPLAIHADCMVACEGAGPGCIECGACMEAAPEIAPGGTYDVFWPGVTYTFGQTADHCACYVPADAPAAKYRASVSVYAHAEDAITRMNAIPLTADFSLPGADDVVVLSVGLK
jgi:hypothetical protein